MHLPYGSDPINQHERGEHLEAEASLLALRTLYAACPQKQRCAYYNAGLTAFENGVLGTRAAARNDAQTIARFTARHARAGLRYFSVRECLYRGAGNYNRHSRAFGKNQYPAPAFWDALLAAFRAADHIRHALGRPLLALSIYRHPEYNRAIGGVVNSTHTRAIAIDLAPAQGGAAAVAALLAAARRARKQGVFAGGIGSYRSFVHIDLRGTLADW